MVVHRLLFAFFLVATAGVVGGACTTYTDLDPDNDGRDARVPTPDGTTPSSDSSSNDRMTPPPDTGGNNDTGGAADTSIVDAARDNPAEVAPPDVIVRDGGDDAPVAPDASIDVTPPGTDADIADVVGDADATVPPGPETGPDVIVSDVVDAGVRDADAEAPPRDADGGTVPIDVRDGGPTCWGTPTAHDEDGDGVVDECDNCPSVSNAGQADQGEVNSGASADGVGDACDPRPNAAGDSIFFFDGLNFTSAPSTWTNVGAGTWTASGTSLSPNGTLSGQELERAFPSALGNYLAETTFTFTALENLGSASVPFRTSTARDGWGCGLGINGSTGQLFLTQVTGGVGEAMPTTASVGAPQVGGRFRLLAGAYSTNLYCILAGGGGGRVNRSTSGSTSGECGFRASLADATFEYLLVYRLGGTVP
jgi:hypothetical protein